ncbi:homoprotocatechuate degradation operon regulator HpaR [Alcanivorax sp. N3-2A]|nr:homoprotocatechuate degradation operon regulator HpaR [Alcanivorax sp. N3-2A]|tara:strand:+ start:24816 stop:25244 length:429 start_codon:yes stop_codon:yes gene_type:complete
MPEPTPSLTLALLQGREAAMGFFRPLLNQHGITEQQWRVIRILKQVPEYTLESYRLAELACIPRPSLTGVLMRLERDGYLRRWKPENDQRRLCITLADEAHQLFDAMSDEINRQYRTIREQLGGEDYQTLMGLLERLRRIQP